MPDKNQDKIKILTEETIKMFDLLSKLPKKVQKLERFLTFRKNAK